MKIISYETSCYKSTLLFETGGHVESMDFPVSVTMEEAVDKVNKIYQDSILSELTGNDELKKIRSSHKAKDRK